MAWTTPRTWVPGEVVTAAQLNTHLRDNLSDLDSRMNTAVQLVQETETGVDGNGSLVLAATTTVVVLNISSAIDVNGATVPVRSPWMLTVVNVTSNIETLKHEDATETTPAKRFILPGDTDLALGLGDGVFFMYITVPLGARWVSVVAA